MIKIFTGYSNLGGSTIAHINLCNLFNDNGFDCELYGDNTFILDKCRSKLFKDYKLDTSETVIYHFISPRSFDMNKRGRKIIYSCHEDVSFVSIKNFVPPFTHQFVDCIHFVSPSQASKQAMDNIQSMVIPNVLSKLNQGTKPKTKVGGIIGSIDKNKQPVISLERAIKDGCTEVKSFGMINDQHLYQDMIQVAQVNKIKLSFLVETDKQKMYDQVTDVYHSSIVETWGYVEGECKLTGTNFHTLTTNNNHYTWDNVAILNAWQEKIKVNK